MTKKHSRFLSLVLRHSPGLIGIQLDKHGWIDVETLLRAIRDYGRDIDREQLNYVVATNNKRRFEFHGDGKKIRACQGHSIPVELGYEPQKPPEFLFHGTVKKAVETIKEHGISKMSRHAVHLSEDTQTATIVGKRRGSPLILRVEARRMHQAGYEFTKSPNNVWLVDRVPTKFIQWEGSA